MSVEQSTLNAFMDAVTNYYGGADIWTGITDTGAFTSADFAAKVTQVDGVSAVYNSAGDVLYYKYNDQIVANSLDLSNTINSNVGSTISSSSVNLPANTTIGTGNTVEATSGMVTTGSTTVATVVKDVALGVAAVGAGIQLGAAIDGALYNLNPDFWDANNMSALNPQTWDTLVSDYGEPAQQVFNMVFGIDKNTNKVQPYLDERALAYIAQYLTYTGAWGGGSGDGAIPADNPYNLPACIFRGRDSFTIPPTPSGSNWFVVVDAYYVAGISGFLVASDHAGVITDAVGGHYSESSYTYNGKTVYYFNFTTYPGWDSVGGYNPNIPAPFPNNYSMLAWAMVYGGYVTPSGVNGITTQDGATIPTGITPQMSIDDVLTQLRLLYPDLFADKITNDVVQPDGTITTYTYVPVAIPENIPLDDVTTALNPTGGVDLTQGNTSIDPTTTPDNIIDTLLKIIGSVNPNSPTQSLTDTPTEYPDTGDGTTPIVVIPTGSANALYSIYNPTQAQLNSLGAWLWSSDFVDQLLKVFNDPMQAIIGLHKVFVNPPISGSGTIKVGYLNSGVSANLVNAQYTEVDCGTVNVPEYFGNSLDYTNTDIMLYLPFIGIVPLNVDDVMRGTVNIKYKVDVLTGACLAQVNIIRDGTAGGQIYVYSGNCAVQYPLSSGSYMGILSGALGIAASIVSAIGSGGATVPLALGAGASALSNMKTHIEHSGSLSGNAGAMGIKKPYIIFRRPQTKFAFNYVEFAGSDENMNTQLIMLTGYIRVKYCHLENIPATSQELSQIEELLKTGIII